MLQTDSLGRSTFHYIRPQADIRPTPREVRWLKHIQRHGPQSSVYLYELTRDTHRCRDTALRQMQKLRAGGFLMLPRQQRSTEWAEFNPYIYDLTDKARTFLSDRGLLEPPAPISGPWWHRFMTACVTASIDIAAGRTGIRYLPAHKILAIKNAPLAIPLPSGKLIPDQLFALDYGGRYRAFALEVDRGTEPISSRQSRKSYARSTTQYRELLGGQLHKAHYGLKANLLVLWVFTRPGSEARFLEGAADLAEAVGRCMLMRTARDFGPPQPPALLSRLVSGPWRNAAGGRLMIGAP